MKDPSRGFIITVFLVATIFSFLAARLPPKIEKEIPDCGILKISGTSGSRVEVTGLKFYGPVFIFGTNVFVKFSRSTINIDGSDYWGVNLYALNFRGDHLTIHGGTYNLGLARESSAVFIQHHE